MGKKFLYVLLFVSVLAGMYYIFFRKSREIKVLVFSKTTVYRHASIEDGKLAIMELSKKHNFSVDTTEDASNFTESKLQNYNVIVFLNTTGDVLDDAQQLEMNRFIQAGGGFVGIHAATDTEYEWPWYGELIGAYFNGHPEDSNLPGELKVVNTEHESTQHFKDSTWVRSGEWYNFKDIKDYINVLLLLDEDSYEGGTNGDFHPYAWYHEFDGGRVFYTASGHSSETFYEPLFLEHLWGGISYAAGEGVPVNYNNASVAPEENRFQKVVLDFNLNEPMELDLLPNGNILFVERHGTLKLFEKGSSASRVIAQLDVFDGLEDGLLGIAIDPNYVDNNWIYLIYSDTEEWVQHVSRFTFVGDQLDKGSEKVLLKIPTQRDECCHSGGSLEFGPNGNLFISVGDNTNPHNSDGYDPIDEREGRAAWDAQRTSANTDDLRGKILRITPQPDGTYNIPEGNLFEDGSGGRPEIYVMGCRNPFRISIDSRTGYLYWGDVGPDAGKDSLGRGPRGHDEVNQARQAGFYGWPLFVGDNKAYNKYDFSTKKSGDKFNPVKPLNTSPNNTGSRDLPPANPAFIWYPYGPSTEFPLVGEGGRNAMAGPVYYYDDHPEWENKFPKYYDKKLITYDWMRGWVMAVTMDDNGNFVRMERFLPSLLFNNPMDMLMSPEGDIYMLEYGTNWFTQNLDARLVHLTYTNANRTPVANISVNEIVGAAPLTVQFDGSKSIDFDGDELVFSWDFGDGSETSNEQNPKHTFDKPGEYITTLEIEDPSGEKAVAKATLLVGNELPRVDLSIEGNTQFFWDNVYASYEINVIDAEDGTTNSGIPAEAVTITFDYLQQGHDVTKIGQGHQAMKEASAYIVGKTLMEQSDCKSCHQVDQKSIGPTYLEIGNRYKNDEKVVPKLAEKIISGGGGNWGDVAMAAHPQISKQDAEHIVKYLLSLSGRSLETGLPLSGKLSFDKHAPNEVDGNYILTVTYTDKGGEIIGPLTSRAIHSFKWPVIAAVDFSSSENTMVFNINAGDFPGVDEDMSVLVANHDAIIQFDSVDLTGIKAMKISMGVSSAFTAGGTYEVRIDSVDGQLIGTSEVEIGLTDIGFMDSIMVIEEVAGIHNLIFIVKSADPNKPLATFITIDLLNRLP